MTTKKTRCCNVFPRVWAAMHGCRGHGKYRGYNRLDGKMYACDECWAAKSVTGSEPSWKIQTFLHEVQEFAGVENYRYQRTGRCKKTKRPYLVIDGEQVFCEPFTAVWPRYSPLPQVR